MATHTAYYNLTKPAQNDKVNIGVLNDNADIIDTALHNKVDLEDLTASNVMLSDGVTSVEDRLDAHTFGTYVDISAYNSASNLYICPSDGYVQIALSGDGSMGDIYVEGANLMRINAYSGNKYPTASVFVKKGMHVYLDILAGSGSGRFYPLT